MEHKPIESKCISAGTRTYYIDVRVDRKSQKYLTISEIPTSDKVKRQRIFIHAETIGPFINALNEIAASINQNHVDDGKKD